MDNDRVVVSCSHCGGRLRLPVGKVGRVKCPHPHCGRSFWVNTNRGGGLFRRVQSLWHNDGSELAGMLFLAVALLWLPAVVLVHSRRLIYFIFDGAVIAAVGAWLFGRSIQGRPFQLAIKLARIYFSILSLFAGIFAALHFWLATRSGDVSPEATLADVQRYLDSNSKWVLGWIEPVRVVLLLMALTFLFLIVAPALNRRRWLMRRAAGYSNTVIGIHAAVTVLLAFLLCGTISDANIEGQTRRMEYARDGIMWEYFQLRRDIAHELFARILAEQGKDTGAAGLQQLVQGTLDKKAAPAVKRITEFIPPFYLAPAAESTAADSRIAALDQSLDESALENTSIPREVGSADELKNFTIGRFYNTYSGYETNWQRTRDSISDLEKQRDTWEGGYGMIDRSQIPDNASRAAISKWREVLPEWFGPRAQPKSEVETVIEQTIDVDCNKVLAPLVSATFTRPDIDFRTEEVRACSDAFLDKNCQEFLAKLGEFLLSADVPDKAKVMAAFSGFPKQPEMQALVARLRALHARVQRDCAAAADGVQSLDSELDRKLDHDFPSYLKRFETFSLGQLSLPTNRIDSAACRSVIRALELHLKMEQDAEARFRLLRKWADSIAAQPNRETAERYAFLTQLEQSALGTTTLKDAVMARGLAQERAGRWGAFRQELARQLAAGQAVIPIGRDHLRALLEKWAIHRADVMGEFYLTLDGDWDCEFARQLTDIHQAAAWGAAITQATNYFGDDVKAARLARAQWLQTNETALALAGADWDGRVKYTFGPSDFARLPELPEDGYNAFMASLRPALGETITAFGRQEMAGIERIDGFINPAYNDCILMVAREVDYRKVVVARYPIDCPPGAVH